MEVASTYKADGNRALNEGRNYEAVSKYTEALKVLMEAQQAASLTGDEIDEDLRRTLAVVMANRSLAYLKIGKRKMARKDAELAVGNDPTYAKAWFRKAKAEIDDNAFDEAMATLEAAPASEDFEKLKTVVAAKRAKALDEPSIKHFEIVDELGTGNYSQIVLVKRKADGHRFALKIIEKKKIEDTAKRHPNVHNEVLMEKRALFKLRGHPNIVTLDATFSDFYALYYLMELLEGGELWAKLYSHTDQNVALPIPESLARFYIHDLTQGLKHIHSLGFAHRDIKPENLMITAGGRLKIVDFGTCKDLTNSDLNGPEFVGTPEYMAPEMVDGKPPATVQVDSWAVGCVAYQLLVGSTPFQARSPYFTFLKIRRANLRVPAHLRPEAVDFISKLIVKEPSKRLNDDEILEHPFAKNKEIVRVGKLRELCLVAVAERAQQLAGDTVVSSPFAPKAGNLKPEERRIVFHRLEKLGAFRNNPSLLGLFFDSDLDARTLRADPQTRTYLGHSRDEHGIFEEPYHAVVLAGPGLRSPDPDDARAVQLTRAVDTINRLRPAVVVCIGDFATSAALDIFRHTMARISASIPVVYAPGPNDNDYTDLFGANYYAFWCRGARFVVVDLQNPSEGQTRFIDEELEINALGSHRLFLVTQVPPLWRVPEKPPLSFSAEEDIPDDVKWAKHLLKGRVDAVLCAATNENKVTKLKKAHVEPWIKKKKTTKPMVLSKDDDDDDDDDDHGDGTDDEDVEDRDHNDIDDKQEVAIISTSPVAGAIGAEERIPAGLRLMTIFENTFDHRFFPLEEVPTAATFRTSSSTEKDAS